MPLSRRPARPGAGERSCGASSGISPPSAARALPGSFDASVVRSHRGRRFSPCFWKQTDPQPLAALRGTAPVDGATMHIDDGLDPPVFQVTNVHADADRNRVSFAAGRAGRRSSRCLLKVRRARCGASITVCHNGWKGIGPDASYNSGSVLAGARRGRTPCGDSPCCTCAAENSEHTCQVHTRSGETADVRLRHKCTVQIGAGAPARRYPSGP